MDIARQEVPTPAAAVPDRTTILQEPLRRQTVRTATLECSALVRTIRIQQDFATRDITVAGVQLRRRSTSRVPDITLLQAPPRQFLVCPVTSMLSVAQVRVRSVSRVGTVWNRRPLHWQHARSATIARRARPHRRNVRLGLSVIPFNSTALSSVCLALLESTVTLMVSQVLREIATEPTSVQEARYVSQILNSSARQGTIAQPALPPLSHAEPGNIHQLRATIWRPSACRALRGAHATRQA